MMDGIAVAYTRLTDVECIRKQTMGPPVSKCQELSIQFVLAPAHFERQHSLSVM